MREINDEDISKILKHWSDAKDEISELEEKISKYKRIMNKIMLQRERNQITDGNFTIKKREISRETVAKQDLPADVWYQYAKRITYPVYYLSENK